MKKLITLGLYGLVVFAATGASAWYFHSQALTDELAKEEEPEPTSLTPRQATGDEVLTPRQPDEVIADEETPVAVRPEKLSVEEIVRLGLSIKEREHSLRQRESELKKIEARHQLMLADIEAEQKTVQGLFAQISDQRDETVELLKDLKQRESLMQQQSEAMEKEESSPTAAASNADRTANLKEMSEVISAMEPQKAADVITNFANGGKMDLAAQMLSSMEDKRVADILAEITDEVLVSDIINARLAVKREPKPVRR